MYSRQFEDTYNRDMDAKILQSELEKKRGSLKRFYKKMLQHPRLLKKFSDLGGYLRYEGTLPEKIRNWTILHLSQRLNAEQTFAVHIKNSTFSQSQIFERPFCHISKLIEAFLKREKLSSIHKEELINDLEEKGFYELIVLIGFYTNLITANQMLDLE